MSRKLNLIKLSTLILYHRTHSIPYLYKCILLIRALRVYKGRGVPNAWTTISLGSRSCKFRSRSSSWYRSPTIAVVAVFRLPRHRPRSKHDGWGATCTCTCGQPIL